MNNLKYTFTRGPLTDEVSALNLNPHYLQVYKSRIEHQLSPFLQQIIYDEAEIELTVSPNGKEILYWKVIKWNAAGYDRLITSNVI